jgi:hypothetical protein
MRVFWAVSVVLVALALVGGCSVASEDLSAGMRNTREAGAGHSVNASIGGHGTAGTPSGLVVHQGFAIQGFRAKRDGHGMVVVFGELKNVGTATQGVELQATLRDAAGRVLAAESFCPAANHSIVPNEVRPFAHSFGRHDAGARAELRIVRTFYTMDTMGMAALPR